MIGAPFGGICGFAVFALSDFLRGSLSPRDTGTRSRHSRRGATRIFPGQFECVVALRRRYSSSDLSHVQDSYLLQGQAVILRKPHRLLGQFVIPWYFGDQRKSLIRAIEAAIQSQDGYPTQP